MAGEGSLAGWALCWVSLAGSWTRHRAGMNCSSHLRSTLKTSQLGGNQPKPSTPLATDNPHEELRGLPPLLFRVPQPALPTYLILPGGLQTQRQPRHPWGWQLTDTLTPGIPGKATDPLPAPQIGCPRYLQRSRPGAVEGQPAWGHPPHGTGMGPQPQLCFPSQREKIHPPGTARLAGSWTAAHRLCRPRKPEPCIALG